VPTGIHDGWHDNLEQGVEARDGVLGGVGFGERGEVVPNTRPMKVWTLPRKGGPIGADGSIRGSRGPLPRRRLPHARTGSCRSGWPIDRT
jgi:hypothetical protein